LWTLRGGFNWADVDFRARELHIQRALAENIRSGGRKLSEPKTESSIRTVSLSRLALAAPRRHRERLKAVPHGERLIFTDTRGGMIRRSNFRRRVWLPLLKRAKLDGQGFRFHDTHHTAASAQLVRGESHAGRGANARAFKRGDHDAALLTD
jgi:integrase